MICPACQGEGWLEEGLPEPEICWECQGSGLAYCCEGEVAEPEGER